MLARLMHHNSQLPSCEECQVTSKRLSLPVLIIVIYRSINKKLCTYFAVFNSSSMTKSMLKESTLAKAKALMIEHLSLISFADSF
jgi:hypothetical protein